MKTQVLGVHPAGCDSRVNYLYSTPLASLGFTVLLIHITFSDERLTPLDMEKCHITLMRPSGLTWNTIQLLRYLVRFWFSWPQCVHGGIPTGLALRSWCFSKPASTLHDTLVLLVPSSNSMSKHIPHSNLSWWSCRSGSNKCPDIPHTSRTNVL